MHLKWYFDFISPYAYLQCKRLVELPAAVELELVPVLFAGLLNHWGQLGPAEIEPKRLFTYRHIAWLAARHGQVLKMPAAHPFNPLPLLRLAVALGSSATVVQRIFDFVWVDGGRVDDAASVARLGQSLGLADTAARLDSVEVKQALLRNGEQAVAAGVFGVPSLVSGDLVLWGQDAIHMIEDWVADPMLFTRGDMGRLVDLPAAASRKRGQ